MPLNMHSCGCVTHTNTMTKRKRREPQFSNHWLDLANNLANDITFHKLFSNSLTKDGIQEATEYLWTHMESLSAPSPMTQRKELSQIDLSGYASGSQKIVTADLTCHS